jgi:heme-degrading monooxygenase HmoA
MIIGQTVFRVRKGTEHRAQRALDELAGLLATAGGHHGHLVLRSVGMSPLASALHDQVREAELDDVHFVIQTEWESREEHDAFYRSEGVQRAYAMLSSILTSGPYEVLYEELVDKQQHVAV